MKSRYLQILIASCLIVGTTQLVWGPHLSEVCNYEVQEYEREIETELKLKESESELNEKHLVPTDLSSTLFCSFQHSSARYASCNDAEASVSDARAKTKLYLTLQRIKIDIHLTV